MPKTVTFKAVVALIMFAAALIPTFIHARRTPAMNACVNNLQKLDGDSPGKREIGVALQIGF